MEELKASGNAAFKKGDFASAVDFFTRAIDDAATTHIENHHVLYSNRSAARVRCRQKSSLSSFCRFDSGERFFLVVVVVVKVSRCVVRQRESIGTCVGRFGRF